jgi:uncharacterized protein
MQLAGNRLVLSPSDLNDYVECEHLTALARDVAVGTRPRPHVPNEYAELLRRKGAEHEAAYLAQLRREGRQVVDAAGPDPWDFEAAARVTVEAMRAGAEIVYQATFVYGDWRGRADLLERVERATTLGGWGYEPVDAKLARAEKPTYVLQLCFYSEAIAAIQGSPPEAMHVLLGGGERATLRFEDYAAYYRRVRRGFEAALARRTPTEPYPVEHCQLCEFRGVCDEWWRRQDHLALVAGMRREQVRRLSAGGIPTLTRLAQAPPETRIEHVAAHTFETLREQAELQARRRASGQLDCRVLPVEPGRGFQRLPPPSPGDVIFDIEGDPFWEPARGLHFLFGLLVADPWRYQTFWAHDRAGERQSFERLVDYFHARLAAHPTMHVYHYGAYETTALKQLMGVYATREDAVDELLRREVFVDLHSLVRQGLRAGVESYSLKEIEALPAFQRGSDITRGAVAVLEYEQWMVTQEDARLAAIAAYNEEDCRATLVLRDWLLGRRPEGAAWAAAPAREISEEGRATSAAREALRQGLLAGAAEGSPRWLAAELLEYHRREARPAWWWFFERRRMSLDELVDDAEAIGRLAPAGRPVPARTSMDHPLRFPAQQHKLSPGDEPVDPATGARAGEIQALDDLGGTLTLRRGPSLASVALPTALIPPGPHTTREQQAAVGRLAASALAGDGRYPALADLLARRPRFRGRTPGQSIQTTALAELRELAATLEGSYLFIQGPPGTGKTWTGARIVIDLIRRGRRVGVTATTHKAIHNMLDEIEKAARAEGFRFLGVKRANAGSVETEYSGEFIRSETRTDKIVASALTLDLVAGTAWLFAHHSLDGARLIDTLVIDEAGQVALADALAMGTAARNLVLLGDPLQLAQVSPGSHPPGVGSSVLEHLLADHPTVPPDVGIFLDRTRRMHPDVCRFVSEVVYDGRLRWLPEVERQGTPFGTGLRFLGTDHAGNAVSSREEALRVVSAIRAMLDRPWTNVMGASAPLRQADFMVVAPYNAQVRCLRQTLDAAGLAGVPAGTVDKFQGREAAVVFYSMATSSADDVPRTLEFLFSRNRLNVAVSRAMCLAYVVASPRLLESRARTIEQMRLVNALCRFVEMAKP